MADNRKQRENILPFPNLKERLIEKGFDQLQHKQFQEALLLFDQAGELERDHPEIELGTVLCLFELNRFEEAKEICNSMLQKGIGDYYQVLQIYTSILLQQGHYNEIITTIEAILQEGNIPSEYAENLFKLLDFSRKMNVNNVESGNNDNIAEGDTFDQMLNQGDDIEEHWKAIQLLRNQNVRRERQTIETYLINPNKSPLIKSALLQVLMEQEVEFDISIIKFNRDITIKPTELLDSREDPFTKEVLTILEKNVLNENPTLYEVIQEIWFRHLFILFPLYPEPKEANLWAAALHIIALEMQGFDHDRHSIVSKYDVNNEQLMQACEAIYKIEDLPL
ncbi:tetratricopeptide repeat protein [Cytobacillus sp. Hm23]